MKLKSKKFKKQTNPSIIRIDYLKTSGAKDLLDLKNNYVDYYNQLMEELNSLSRINSNLKKVSPEKKSIISNLVETSYYCKKCNEVLFEEIGSIKIYYKNTPHMYLNGVIKVLCSCGEKNIFSNPQMKNKNN